jgi:hypothetical protein
MRIRSPKRLQRVPSAQIRESLLHPVHGYSDVYGLWMVSQSQLGHQMSQPPSDFFGGGSFVSYRSSHLGQCLALGMMAGVDIRGDFDQ